MRNIFVFFLVSVFFGLLPLSRADASIYQIHFRYDKGSNRLMFDESKGNPIQVNPDQNLNPLEFFDEGAGGDFSLVFLFENGEEIARKNFSPDTDGAFLFDAPYLSFARSLAVYQSGISAPILSQDLSQFLTCNENNICEYENGENMNTCIPDCVGTAVHFSPETQKLLKQNNDVIKDPKSGEVILRGVQVAPVATAGTVANTSSGTNMVVLIIGIVALVLVGIGTWIVVKLWRRNKQYGL